MIAHVFVDAENIPPSVTFKVVEYFGKQHTITKVDIIAKEDTLPSKYRELDGEIYRVQNCFYGKNSADTWLCFEMVRAIIDEPDLELIIIISSDKDFLAAIKFAVDFDKKVLIVSNGAGHRTLIEQMKILEIDPAWVELKDFRFKFSEVSQKLQKFLPHFGFELKKYLLDREARVKFIFFKKGEQIYEVPFVAGIGILTFRRILRELNILDRKDSLSKLIAGNFLKLWRDRIYFQSEEEISEPTPAEQIKSYFADHTADIKKIFIKHGEKLFEIPFVDGMPLDIFGKFLREKKIIGKTASPLQVAEKNLLKVSGDKIFLRNEEELKTVSSDSFKAVDDYLTLHAAELKKIFIKHNGKISEIPFVNGMPLELFGKLLREQKVIGKNTSPLQTATKNLLKIWNDKVYLHGEEDLTAAYGDSLKNVDEYLKFHAAELKKVLIKHNQKIFEVPFVDGISLELFGKILRERNIIGKSTSATSIAKKNLLDVRDGKIYLCDEERLSELYAEATGNLDAYFSENAAQVIKIFVKRNDNLFEIPFVDGMPLTLFEKLLHGRNIIGKNSSAVKVAAQSLLNVHDERIFLYSEDALENIQNDSLINVDDYLNEHALEIRNAIINHGGENFSIPFVDGIPLEFFGKLLRERKIIDVMTSPEKVAKDNGFEIRAGRIFIGKEES